ncbi:MAG: ATP-binding cassette domain-containing protein [Clostridiales bacterium]|nr:ATP-binding cassette domain-containing protein [Clostridiales bacterium]
MLKLCNVTKVFHPNTVNENKAIDNLSFELKKGDFVTVLGSNGSGKSTMFNLIAGSLLADSGQIYLEGENITLVSDYIRAKKIGRIFQDPMKGTSPSLTIEENLSLAYARKSKSKIFAINKADREAFVELLSKLDLGLENRLKTKIGLLSGGQRQAVTLLMSTIADPSLLLLDEHTAALDPNTAVKILDITKELVEYSKTSTMMITHDINAALSIGNRTIMMDAGRIILDISGEERENMTVDALLKLYSKESKKQLANDRMLFSAGGLGEDE